MAASSDNGAVHLSRRAHAGVRPNDRVLDPCALFDVTATTQDRVDNLRARFDRAIVRNHGKLVDLGMRGGIKAPVALFDVNPGNSIRQ